MHPRLPPYEGGELLLLYSAICCRTDKAIGTVQLFCILQYINIKDKNRKGGIFTQVGGEKPCTATSLYYLSETVYTNERGIVLRI